ncbi:MAG: hypothetical protein JNK15_15510 [Planctomycetes bacterium]|nr:hypothetical protein [Planctomycetota bacterium]
MHQTPYQKILWLVACQAHAAGDRADARIILKMVEAIDGCDYVLARQLRLALRAGYRDQCGEVPAQRGFDEAMGG